LTTKTNKLDDLNLNVNVKYIKDLEELYLRSERAKNASDQALNLATNSYNNASNILKTLENFDTIFQENKKKADDAILLKDKIDNNIAESNKLLNQFNNNLRKTKENLDSSSSNLKRVEFVLNFKSKVIFCFYIIEKRIFFFDE
jgi:ABC-type transporter Mla subunit MlaD